VALQRPTFAPSRSSDSAIVLRSQRCSQAVKLCERAGLVKLGHVSLDGVGAMDAGPL
jgi:hypothetical protein